MYLHDEHKPLQELRWNTYGARTAPRLQQKWLYRSGSEQWTEWRDVPTVEDAPGLKEPVPNYTLD